MRLASGAFWACVGLVVLLLAMGAIGSGFWGWAVAVLGLGGLWAFAAYRGLRWRVNVFGPLFLAAGIPGYLWLGFAPGLALSAVIVGLAAWDLDYFLQRMQAGEVLKDDFNLEAGHLRRLGLVIGLSFALGGLALASEIQLSFGWALVLALLAMVGLIRGVRYLRWGKS